MKKYTQMSKEELLALKSELEEKYEEVKSENLALDMSRGKPAAAQLDISMPMMSILDEHSVLKSENGTDCRNYGILDGIPEAKKLMAAMMNVQEDQVIVYGNSSLNIMYDTIARSKAEAIGHFVMDNPNATYDSIIDVCSDKDIYKYI